MIYDGKYPECIGGPWDGHTVPAQNPGAFTKADGQTYMPVRAGSTIIGHYYLNHIQPVGPYTWDWFRTEDTDDGN